MSKRKNKKRKTRSASGIPAKPLTYRENVDAMVHYAPGMPYSTKNDIRKFISLISANVAKKWCQLIVKNTRFFYEGYNELGEVEWYDEFLNLMRIDFSRAKANALYRANYKFEDPIIHAIFREAFPPIYTKSGHKYEYGVKRY